MLSGNGSKHPAKIQIYAVTERTKRKQATTHLSWGCPPSSSTPLLRTIRVQVAFTRRLFPSSHRGNCGSNTPQVTLSTSLSLAVARLDWYVVDDIAKSIGLNCNCHVFGIFTQRFLRGSSLCLCGGGDGANSRLGLLHNRFLSRIAMLVVISTHEPVGLPEFARHVVARLVGLSPLKIALVLHLGPGVVASWLLGHRKVRAIRTSGICLSGRRNDGHVILCRHERCLVRHGGSARRSLVGWQERGTMAVGRERVEASVSSRDTLTKMGASHLPFHGFGTYKATMAVPS